MNSLAPKNSLCLRPPAHVPISGTDSRQKIALKRAVDGHDRVDCYLIGPPVYSQQELEQQLEE
ncbi:hypothetical protein ACFL1C_09935 [Pseudomonadota bacterium]